MRAGLDLGLQVKQFVAEVNGDFGSRWRVFRTGSAAYLFVLVQNPDIFKSVHPRELQPDVRSALANGWGHTDNRCSNCGQLVRDHCTVHLIPCCPGRCPGA